MGWHEFTAPAENPLAPGDGTVECECRVDDDLYSSLIDRGMWDRVLEKLYEILPHLLAGEIHERFEEFEVFDLYDDSSILAFRYNRTENVWDLFESTAEIEWSADDDEQSE